MVKVCQVNNPHCQTSHLIWNRGCNTSVSLVTISGDDLQVSFIGLVWGCILVPFFLCVHARACVRPHMLSLS